MDIDALYSMKTAQIAELYKATQIVNHSKKEDKFLHNVIFPGEFYGDKTLREIVNSTDTFALVDGINTNRDGSLRILVPVVEGRYKPPNELTVEAISVFRRGGFDQRSVDNYNKIPEPKL